jgi:hypothetical protein
LGSAGAEPAAEPSFDLDRLPVTHEPEPPPVRGAAAWESAARSKLPEIPSPTPLAARPPVTYPLPPRRDVSTGVLFARVMIGIGVACVVLGFLPVGCWRAFYSFEKVEVKALGGVKPGTRVEVVDGVADWNDATVVDPDSPTLIADSRELRRRAGELKGKLVRLSSPPVGAYMYKQYRIGPSGQREEIPGVSRVYLPLALDNSVWAISGLIQAGSFDAPQVKAEMERIEHTGVLQLLSENVSLNDIRNPEHVRGSAGGRTAVPDDALAIVHVETSGESRKYSVARIAGTQGRYVVATTDVRPSAEESLFVELHPCPSKTCQSFAATLADEPAGVLVLSASKAFPWKTEVAMFILLGVGLAVGGVMMARRLSE